MANNQFSSMLLEVNSDAKELAKKLDSARLTIVKKDQMIEGLQRDLAHMVDQFSKLNYTNYNQWMNRESPGVRR